MINRKAKGYRSEKKTEKWLKEQGFGRIETVKSTKSFGKQDFFGLFDHIAIADKQGIIKLEEIDNKKNKAYFAIDIGTIIFIQTKTNRKPSKKQMEEHINFRVRGHKMLIVWNDRIKEPRLISLNRKFNGK